MSDIEKGLPIYKEMESNHILCPYCKYANDFEYDSNLPWDENEDGIVKCVSCNDEFILSLNIITTYNSHKIIKD